MRNTGKKVMVMQGFFKAIERTVWTDGKGEYVKIKGNVHVIEPCGTTFKYDKEVNRMVETTAYMAH